MKKLKKYLSLMDVPYREKDSGGKPMVQFEYMGVVYAILPSASGTNMYSVLMGYNTIVPSGLVMGFENLKEWVHRLRYPEDFETEVANTLDMPV